jgi:hypothetical protein
MNIKQIVTKFSYSSVLAISMFAVVPNLVLANPIQKISGYGNNGDSINKKAQQGYIYNGPQVKISCNNEDKDKCICEREQGFLNKRTLVANSLSKCFGYQNNRRNEK